MQGALQSRWLACLTTNCSLVLGEGSLTSLACCGCQAWPARLVVCCRSASALEEAARTHKERTGRPFVLIIDAVDRLAEHAPDILETLQERHCLKLHLLHIIMVKQCICQVNMDASWPGW